MYNKQSSEFNLEATNNLVILNPQFDATDKEIDRMVYKLYNLTATEI